MMLFYKLWALERAAHTLETWHSYSLTDRYGQTEWLYTHTHTHTCWFCTVSLCSPLPQTAGEWAQVLQIQRQFHQAQMNKWQQILQSSVTLLDQVCAWAELKMSSSGSRNTAFAENKLEVITVCQSVCEYFVFLLLFHEIVSILSWKRTHSL